MRGTFIFSTNLGRYYYHVEILKKKEAIFFGFKKEWVIWERLQYLHIYSDGIIYEWDENFRTCKEAKSFTKREINKRLDYFEGLKECKC